MFSVRSLQNERELLQVTQQKGSIWYRDLTCLNVGCARVPRSLKTPTPLGSPLVLRHKATVVSYGRGIYHERGAPVDTRHVLV